LIHGKNVIKIGLFLGAARHWIAFTYCNRC
jgi:hypothetical protein